MKECLQAVSVSSVHGVGVCDGKSNMPLEFTEKCPVPVPERSPVNMASQLLYDCVNNPILEQEECGGHCVQ